VGDKFCKDIDATGDGDTGGTHRQLSQLPSRQLSASGDDKCIHVKTVFTLAESIDATETATVFLVLIGATMVLEILVEYLNEVCRIETTIRRDI
jgi:hypothetical protein